MKKLIILFFATVFLMASIGFGHSQEKKIKIDIDARDPNNIFNIEINQWMRQAISSSSRHEIVERKDAQYLLIGTLLVALEKPEVGAIFNIILLEIKPPDGMKFLLISTTSLDKSNPNSSGLTIKQAVERVVKDCIISTLRFDWEKLKHQQVPQRKNKIEI